MVVHTCKRTKNWLQSMPALVCCVTKPLQANKGVRTTWTPRTHTRTHTNKPASAPCIFPTSQTAALMAVSVAARGAAGSTVCRARACSCAGACSATPVHARHRCACAWGYGVAGVCTSVCVPQVLSVCSCHSMSMALCHCNK